MAKHNLNDYIIVFPSKKGWEEIKRIISKRYNYNESQVGYYIKEATTETGGFVEVMWQFITLFHEMIYHGTNNFETMNFEIKSYKKKIK